ncbi:unnamed protein product [Phytomonas sp. EM1]|nr:unnamed protein product [Phytomonas sp. EM1]|eukprot:CCW65847.1 unnamed protein product [Phytomonas sp. isolate EM1]
MCFAPCLYRYRYHLSGGILACCRSGNRDAPSSSHRQLPVRWTGIEQCILQRWRCDCKQVWVLKEDRPQPRTSCTRALAENLLEVWAKVIHFMKP